MQAKLPNTTLNYERIGSSEKKTPVLLFLHEALGGIGQWKQFPEMLCERLNLPGIVYERQGHGQSSALSETRKADYLHSYALKELPEFLEAIAENRPLILIGHSDGGTIALLFASKYRERIAGIVTMAAHVINEPETIAGIAPAIAAYRLGKLDGLQKYHGDKTDALFYAWADIWRSTAFIHWDITSEISESLVPGLFMQGADDQYGTSKQLHLIDANYAGASSSILLTNCGHHPHLEQTEKVLQSIEEFVATFC